MKKILGYIILTITLFYQGYCFADDKFSGAVDVIEGLKGSDTTADSAVQLYVSRVLNYIYVLAIVWGIYGGFLIFSAGSDDEKVKKGKQVIIEAGIGIVIIFLANSIVKFIIEGILK